MTVEAKFRTFHTDNPHVYDLFKRFADEAIKAGMKRISSKFIVNRIRWEAAITTTGAGWHIAGKRPFKIDDRFTPWYARMFCDDFPSLAPRIELRRIRTP